MSKGVLTGTIAAMMAGAIGWGFGYSQGTNDAIDMMEDMPSYDIEQAAYNCMDGADETEVCHDLCSYYVSDDYRLDCHEALRRWYVIGASNG
jgi:hypothetical protein